MTHRITLNEKVDQRSLPRVGSTRKGMRAPPSPSLMRAVIGLLGTLGCSTSPPALGVRHGALTPCPNTPNCVSSDARDSKHYVAPFAVRDASDATWQGVKRAVSRLPRTKIVEDDGNYVRAEATSLIFRFVDDLELHFRRDQRLVGVRSASRVGSGDLGVNRRRVEKLRELLRADELLRSPG